MPWTERAHAVHAARKALANRLGRVSQSGIPVAPPKASRLDPELKARWVAALRSDTFVQGFGNLRQRDAGSGRYCHCVLGVLCEIMAPEGFEDVRENGRTISLHRFTPTSRQRHHPNQQKMIALGLYPSAMKKLSLMNDTGRSFRDLARYINKSF